MPYLARRRIPWWMSDDRYLRRQRAWPRGWREEETENGDGQQRWAPVTDLIDRGDHLLARVELPGVPQEKIDLSLEEGILTIKGEREEEEEEGEWLCCERPSGAFYRAIQLPGEVDADAVGATYKNGVLTIVLPKTPEAQTRHIAVTAS
jgi:HSP20 family protein